MTPAFGRLRKEDQESGARARDMAYYVKVLAARHATLSLIPRTHLVEGEKKLPPPFCLLHMSTVVHSQMHTCAPTHAHIQINIHVYGLKWKI